MNAFAPLLAELDAWGKAGRVAEFWWRDDDAADASPALDTMLSIREEAGVPLALAVIPMAATARLAQRLTAQPDVAVWQHGIRHCNRAEAPAKKQELTDAAPALCQELRAGAGRLGGLFGAQARPVLVPPWNRVAPPLLRYLPGLGFAGLSTFKPRASRSPVPGLLQVNTHVDVLDWPAGGAFRGAAACVRGLVEHLHTRRDRTVDAGEPTGVLTHHLVMQSDAWDFLRGLFAATRQHPSCLWTLPQFAALPPEPP